LRRWVSAIKNIEVSDLMEAESNYMWSTLANHTEAYNASFKNIRFFYLLNAYKKMTCTSSNWLLLDLGSKQWKRHECTPKEDSSSYW
jgi:hypothetical protein